MTDTKFTQGPWKVFYATNGKLLGIGEENAEGVTDGRFGLWRDGDEKEANAHLIAAAPELYAALKAAQWDNDSECIFCGGQPSSAHTGQCGISQVLLKANGGKSNER